MPLPETLPPKDACQASVRSSHRAPSAMHEDTYPAADFTLPWGGNGLLGILGRLWVISSPKTSTVGGPQDTALLLDHT